MIALYAGFGLKFASNRSGSLDARHESYRRMRAHQEWNLWGGTKQEGTHGVAHTPNGDRDALGLAEARTDDLCVVVRRRVDDVELCSQDGGQQMLADLQQRERGSAPVMAISWTPFVPARYLTTAAAPPAPPA